MSVFEARAGRLLQGKGFQPLLRRSAAGILLESDFFVYNNMTNRLTVLDRVYSTFQTLSCGFLISDRDGKQSDQVQKISVGCKLWLPDIDGGIVAKANQCPIGIPNGPSLCFDDKSAPIENRLRLIATYYAPLFFWSIKQNVKIDGLRNVR